MTFRIVYRRRRDICRVCTEPIERDPTTDGSLYGWRPTASVCYHCWAISLFGVGMMPTEAWWRLARKLVAAGHALSLHNDGTEHDEDITF